MKVSFLVELFLQTFVFQEDSIPNQAIKSVDWSRFTFSQGFFSAGALYVMTLRLKPRVRVVADIYKKSIAFSVWSSKLSSMTSQMLR